MTRPLAVFLTIDSSAQKVELAIRNKIDSLRLSNIETFLTYSIECNGAIAIDTCSYEAPQYLLWLKNDRYFFQKFGYCRDSKLVELDNKNPLVFYLKNIQEISKEHIKPPTYIVSKKGDVVKTNSLSVSHSCYHEIVLQHNGKTLRKTVSNFDLAYRSFYNGKKNMFFEYNQRTKVNRLVNDLQALLKKVESSE